jgi:hypothetical protein
MKIPSPYLKPYQKQLCKAYVEYQNALNNYLLAEGVKEIDIGARYYELQKAVMKVEEMAKKS